MDLLVLLGKEVVRNVLTYIKCDAEMWQCLLFIDQIVTECVNNKQKLSLFTDPFMHRIVTGPAFFIKHADVLIRTASQLCTGLGKAMPGKSFISY